MAKKSSHRKKHPAPQEPIKTETHEIFTVKRLIILFAVLEILIVALMFPTFRGRWHMNQAKSAAKKKKFEKAYKHYQWLGKHTPAPESATYHLELGNVCMQLESYDEAVNHLKIVITKTDNQKGSNSLLGLAYLKAGNPKHAQRHFAKELEKNPTDAQANFYLGKLAFEAKRYTAATAYFSRVAYLPRYQKRLQPFWRTIEEEVLELTLR